MKTNMVFILAAVLLGLLLGYYFGGRRVAVEKFQNQACSKCMKPTPCGCLRPVKPCKKCNKSRPCGCRVDKYAPGEGFDNSCPPCAPCAEPDHTKWVLKASVPPCPPRPDMTKYMLKTECPPHPDMSKYVLKTSVPKCPPCISTCSKPCKIGECPPCPRPRCPVVKCPEPKACPACPEARCEPCPEPDIKCKAMYEPGTPVRPMLASTSTFGF
jgi:hypothetical protein